MAEGFIVDMFPNGDKLIAEDGRTVYEQQSFDGGLTMGLPDARLSEAAREEAPEGAVTSYRTVSTPRVGVDGLAEALKTLYGDPQQVEEAVPQRKQGKPILSQPQISRVYCEGTGRDDILFPFDIPMMRPLHDEEA
jgi:hypothetical protein